MKLSPILNFLTLGIVLIVPAQLASGANFFTEDFNNDNAKPNMVLGRGFTDTAHGFTGSSTTDLKGAFKIASGEGKRIYLATKEADYSAVDFRFEATVFVPDTLSPWAYAFLGMGDRNATGGHGEPGMPSVAAAIDPTAESLFRGRDNGLDAFHTSIAKPHLGKHRMRMTWNAATKSALFELDLGYTGKFSGEYKFTVDGADNGFTSSNSHLFVGGGDGVTFDDISVMAAPESDSEVLWIIGAAVPFEKVQPFYKGFSKNFSAVESPLTFFQ